jgi:hypothetical protein
MNRDAYQPCLKPTLLPTGSRFCGRKARIRLPDLLRESEGVTGLRGENGHSPAGTSKNN